jgi:RimJ/RimL family protein N-acetyltransferase
MTITIQRLSPPKLSEAQRLVDATFPHYPWMSRRLCFSVSDPQFLYCWALSVGWQITSLSDWVALDTDNRVIGTVGVYTYRKDNNEACWLSWFCVHPNFRGRGFGRELLQFAIHLARQTDKKYLRLHTSTHPSEASAQALYEKCGFRIIGKKSWKECDIVYLELDLLKESQP